MKYKHWLCRILVVQLVLLMLVCPLSMRAEAAPSADVSPSPFDGAYYYYMRVVQTGEKTDAEPTGTIVLELYACTNDANAPILEGASFGFRFPAYFGQVLTFTPSDNIIIQRIVPVYRSPDEVLDKDTYHAFFWNRYIAALGDRNQDVSQWETDPIAAPPGTVGHLLIGTYTFAGNGALPASSSIGQLDWTTAAEAQGAVNEVGVELINDAIWSEEERAYIGFFADETKDGNGQVVDMRIQDTPLKLYFQKPEAWKGIFNVQSYDPKKDLHIQLFAWDEAAEDYHSDADYSLILFGEDSGTGLCVKTIQFHKCEFTDEATKGILSGSELPAGKYRMVISKQSHVCGIFIGLTVNRDESEPVIFPQLEGRSLTLPCGDVTGDGQIRLVDRAELTRTGRYMKAAAAKSVYDLNGDGRVDQKDLAILMAPANYGKNNFVQVFTEATNVGENGI